MKWTNPGHEFDKIGHTLKNMESLYIYYGTEFQGRRAYETINPLLRWLKWQIIFIDSNEEKQRFGFIDLKVLHPEALFCCAHAELAVLDQS